MTDFFIIGAMRCGTTSLRHYLAANPAISMPLREVDYYSFHYDEDRAWYEAKLGDGEVRGEKCVSYMAHAQAPVRILQDDADAKFFILLRNPVDRAWSHYRWAISMRRERRPFREAVHYGPVRNEPWFSYLTRGHYAEQLRHWFGYFPRDRFLIVKSEDFYRDPESTVMEASEFLDVEACLLDAYKQRGTVKYTGVPDGETLDWLEGYYEPHNEELEDLIGLAW